MGRTATVSAAAIVVALSFIGCAPNTATTQLGSTGVSADLGAACEKELAQLDALLRREKTSPTVSDHNRIAAEELRATGFELYSEGEYDLALELLQEAIALLT